MYQVSRAIYRELSPDITGGREEHEAVLRACEATIERMVGDQHYFARPARTLFRDLRPYFDINDWPRVWHMPGGGGGGWPGQLWRTSSCVSRPWWTSSQVEP